MLVRTGAVPLRLVSLAVTALRPVLQQDSSLDGGKHRHDRSQDQYSCVSIQSGSTPCLPGSSVVKKSAVGGVDLRSYPNEYTISKPRMQYIRGKFFAYLPFQGCYLPFSLELTQSVRICRTKRNWFEISGSFQLTVYFWLETLADQPYAERPVERYAQAHASKSSQISKPKFAAAGGNETAAS